MMFRSSCCKKTHTQLGSLFASVCAANERMVSDRLSFANEEVVCSVHSRHKRSAPCCISIKICNAWQNWKSLSLDSLYQLTASMSFLYPKGLSLRSCETFAV